MNANGAGRDAALGLKIAAMVREVEECRKAIASERDKLRTLHGELEDLMDSTDRGVSALEEAVDAFSEYL